jgi:CDP-4-dehydro-6-deoxyglucose reductase
MAHVQFEGVRYLAETGESVLDCLLRNGIAVSHSCKAGACQSCLMKSVGGGLAGTSQAGLKDTLRAQGYFLACTLRPSEDIAVEQPGKDQRVPARIREISALNETVMRVRLVPGGLFDYFAGQYVTLFRKDGLARSYSIASLPQEGELELHVRRIPGGAMSEWLHDVASLGDPVSLQGPSGTCFYVPGNVDEPLLLAGAGTGLAPLYGIVKDALSQGHRGPIWLFHGALTMAGLYLGEELRDLEARHVNFRYVRTVLRDDGAAGAEVGQLHDAILTRFPKLSGWKGYVCGDPALVNSLRKKLFLAGMPSKAIYSDAFLPSSA